MPKKVHETENVSAKERWNTKQNLHFELKFSSSNLRSGVLCLLSLQQARSYHNSSNHLLGNPRYTLTERLLGNLTNRRFLFQMASVWPIKMANLALTHLSTGQIQRLCCLAFLASFPAVSVTPRDALSRVHDGHGAQVNVTNERLLWDIREIFDTKDAGAANFKKIIKSRKHF